MLTGLERLTSRRNWLVPGVNIWGLAGIGEVYFLAAEEVDMETSIYFGYADIGQAEQEVRYEQLTDHRGNNLPATIDSPHIVPLSRSQYPVFLVGDGSDEQFRVARSPEAPGPVLADLLVMEMGA
jgi:hypothetical protein